jgi:4-amino-4-deoxy-L-arabinose transferase-like glycosyltransferase
MTGPVESSRSANSKRWLILGLILVAYGHVTMLLDLKDFWWDESLSLQRAEEGLLELIRGVLWIRDGFTNVMSIDQHPFFSFLIQGAMVRLAGANEFVVRYSSVIGATLLVPAVWIFARWLVRRNMAPASAPFWAALFAAISPFMLWYGQEARPYALWAALAVLTTYLLLRATEDKAINWRFGAGFVVAEMMFLTTHYYAVFLLPLHALILFVWLARRSIAKAIIAALVLVSIGSIAAFYGAYNIFAQGGGQNFPSIALAMLAPDLLNAFSLGLSVDLAEVWWIDWIFGALALGGAIWLLRSRASWSNSGWVLPAFIVIPVAIILFLNEFRPVYMNARHLALLVGAFVLLVSVGLALIWQWRKWVAGIVAIGLVAAIAYSTYNYFAVITYAKDDYTRLGEYMDGRIMPGDAVLLYPPSSWRIFEYYIPLKPVHDAIDQGAPLAIYGAPLLNRSMDETEDWLQELGKQYNRIWLIKSGTHPYYDLKGKVIQWLTKNFLMVRDAEFFSQSSLHAQLYLPKIPVFEALPKDVEHPLTAEYGNLIRLAGYTVKPTAYAGLPDNVRLYWQVLEKPERRYKYILQLVEQAPDGQTKVISTIEREPYEGDIPTLYWDPGKTIMEYVEFPSSSTPLAVGNKRFYTFQMYDAETLEKLPVTKTTDGATQLDATTVVLP